MDALELRLRHADLLGRHLGQADADERGRCRRPALVLRDGALERNRDDEAEGSRERGAAKCACHVVASLSGRRAIPVDRARTASDDCGR
jgi:hypothetical protein